MKINIRPYFSYFRRTVFFLYSFGQLWVTDSSSLRISTDFKNIRGSNTRINGEGNILNLGSESELISSQLNVEGKDNEIIFKSKSFLSQSSVSISGNNNTIEIGENSDLRGVAIEIRGSYNQLYFGNNVYVGEKKKLENGGAYYLLGDHCKISIGDGSSIREATLVTDEINNSIKIGQDCMLADSIRMSTSDGHPIYSLDSLQRVNASKSISIGKHVWICSHVAVLKGSKIDEGCIVGTGSIVTSSTPFIPNATIVGSPAKAPHIENRVTWGRLMFYDDVDLSLPGMSEVYAKSYYCKGLQEVENKFYDNAIQSFLKAIELKLDYSYVQYDLGRAYELTDQNEKAIERYDIASSQNDFYIRAQTAKCRILIKSGMHIEAISILEDLLNIEPSNEILINLLDSISSS